MIYVIGPRGYIGSTFMDHFGDIAKGIGRCDPWPSFSRRDTIINCASGGWPFGETWDAVESNILLSKRILDSANGTRIIAFGSGFETFRPTHIYSRTKGVARDILRGHADIITLYTIFGGVHEQPWRFIGSLLSACRDGKPYEITAPWATRDFVHIDRLVAFVDSLLDKPPANKEHDFGTGNARTLLSVFECLQKIGGNIFPNVSIRPVDLSEYSYCAKEPVVLDTFERDLKREWERICQK